MVKKEQYTRFSGGLAAGALLAVLALGVPSGAAFAQPPGGPGGFGPPGGFGGPGFPGMNRGVTAANAPLNALEAGLSLTGDQKKQVGDIQRQLQKDRQSLMPRFGGPGGGPGGPPGGGPGGGPPNGGQGGPPGGPPDPEAMRAMMEKMRGLEETANKKIEAVLTPDQKKALPGVLKDIQLFGQAGLPADMIVSLKLTPAQKSKIADITKKAQDNLQKVMEEARNSGDFGSVREAMQTSRQKTHDEVMAALTATQRDMVEKFIRDHPRGPGGFGGPGGPGGPGGGRPGGGPPGGGPPDGPPPPDL